MKRDKVSFARLVVDNQRRPATAWIEHGKSAELSQDPQERDENFFRLISQSCGNDTYSAFIWLETDLIRNGPSGPPLISAGTSAMFSTETIFM